MLYTSPGRCSPTQVTSIEETKLDRRDTLLAYLFPLITTSRSFSLRSSKTRPNTTTSARGSPSPPGTFLSLLPAQGPLWPSHMVSSRSLTSVAGANCFRIWDRDQQTWHDSPAAACKATLTRPWNTPLLQAIKAWWWCKKTSILLNLLVPNLLPVILGPAVSSPGRFSFSACLCNAAASWSRVRGSRSLEG